MLSAVDIGYNEVHWPEEAGRTVCVTLLPRRFILIFILICIVALLRHGCSPLLPAPPLGCRSDVHFPVFIDDGLQAPLQRSATLAGLEAWC